MKRIILVVLYASLGGVLIVLALLYASLTAIALFVGSPYQDPLLVAVACTAAACSCCWLAWNTVDKNP